jgi:hypothetical protein
LPSSPLSTGGRATSPGHQRLFSIHGSVHPNKNEIGFQKSIHNHPNNRIEIVTEYNITPDLVLQLLAVYFGTPSMFITLWFGFDYGTNPPLGTLII